MNTRLDEFLSEEHRKDMQRDIQQITLEQKVVHIKVARPSLFTRSMESLGKWLIHQGELLVKRYETPSKKCQPARRNSYAH
jgi:hypothetical protein